MLQSMRQGAQSAAAKIIIGLIVLSFAAFGLETLLPGGSGSSIAEVNGEEISPVALEARKAAPGWWTRLLGGAPTKPSDGMRKAKATSWATVVMSLRLQRFEATSGGRSVATVLYDASKQRLTLVNRGVGLQRRVLLLGTSQKISAEAIGQFGEGMKVGTLALIREGRQVEMATRDASPPRQTLRRRHRSSGSLDDFCDDRSPSPLPHIHRNRWVATFTYVTNCAAGWALTKLFVSIVEQSRYGLGVFLLTLLPRLNRLSHLVLRWPLLVLVYALVGVELILYFLLRTLVAALELAVASPTHRRLRSALRRADDYAQWLACARALDASRGVALWQADLRSTRYNWPFVRRLRARLRSARSQNDWRGVADTLRLCSRPNVGGIMAPELFAVSYAGAPKIVVTDFVDEVCSQRP